MEIQEKIYSFKDAANGIRFEKDPYGLGAYMTGEGIRKTFLSAPALEDMDEPMMEVVTVDGVVAGRNMMYPSRLKVYSDVVSVTSGSSLHVKEEYRQLALGVNLLMYPTAIKRPLLYAGLSTMAEPLYRKMKYAIFVIPKMWQIRNAAPILKSIGMKGWLLNVVKSCMNPLLSIFVAAGRRASKEHLCQYRIERFTTAPQWMEDIVLSDRHKYAELHDRKWMQWVLDHNFFERKEDKQYLYGVYKSEKPVGFLLMAERNFPIPEKNIDRCVYGYVLDWDTIDNSIIDEKQLKTIALSLFSDDVDIVQIDSLDKNVRNSMKRYGFIPHGYENIGFKDTTKKLDKDWRDAANWRLRASYSDRPFY